MTGIEAAGIVAGLLIQIGIAFVLRRRRAASVRDEAALEAMGSELGIDRVPGENIDIYRCKVIMERDRRVIDARYPGAR